MIFLNHNHHNKSASPSLKNLDPITIQNPFFLQAMRKKLSSVRSNPSCVLCAVYYCVYGCYYRFAGSAQQLTATIRGKVIDKDSRQPLFGVNILVLNTNPPQGAVTEADGSFKIEQVTIGRHSIRFTYVGYEEVVISELSVGSGKEVQVTVEMQEKVSNMGEVIVTAEKDKSKANNEYASVSARSFSAEEMSRYAATQNDPPG